MSYRAALHQDDRGVATLSQNITVPALLQDLLLTAQACLNHRRSRSQTGAKLVQTRSIALSRDNPSRSIEAA